MSVDKFSRFQVTPGGVLLGQLKLPGDKSISHRALILGAIAEGETQIEGFLQGEDTLATARALQQMGVDIRNNGTDVLVKGVGLHGLKKPGGVIDLGNSGTSVRLMTGLLSAQGFSSRLTGDGSLMQRPMLRIITPLRRMNANIDCSDQGTLPIEITGGRPLHGIDYTMPVASAQLKSCLLLAGLYAAGQTRIVENKPTRDHTERMLSAFSHPVKRQNKTLSISTADKLVGTRIIVPADFSSAAFFIVAASIVPGSDLLLENVGINPTRDAMLTIMLMMGADIELLNKNEASAEPVADIRIRSSELNGIDIPEELVPIAIDEFPIVFIAAACASGTTRLTGAAELQIKESNRIQSMWEGLVANGITAEATEDGMIIEGGKFKGAEVAAHGDHRIAMAFAVAGMVSAKPLLINDCSNVATSFPGFVELARTVGMDIHYA